jgi:HPt (histidine-containing phosphotransfer) domain-containing protein
MDGYLAKPLHREPLNAALTRWLLAAAKPEEAPLDAHAWEGLEYLEANSGLGAIREVVEDFARDVHPRLVRMRAALDGGDMEALGRLAHDLKSNAATLGASGLSDLAARIERGAREDQSMDFGGLLEECRLRLPGLLRQLRRRIPAG